MIIKVLVKKLQKIKKIIKRHGIKLDGTMVVINPDDYNELIEDEMKKGEKL